MSHAMTIEDANMTGYDADEANPTKRTRTERRIDELKDVEENIGVLLNLAGCTIASLHPDPLSSFSDSIVSLEEAPDSDDDDTEVQKEPVKPIESLSKEEQFTKYAEAYYSTLFDIQRSLRTSIRHLRLSRASSAALLDPSFASLSNSGGAVAPGGLAFDQLLQPLPLRGNLTRSEAVTVEKSATLSVQALKFQKEALESMLEAMSSGKVAEAEQDEVMST